MIKQLKILVALFTIIPVMAAASSNEINNGLNKQCEYLVLGSGTNNVSNDIYILGIIAGVQSVIPPNKTSRFSKNNNRGMIKQKACKNALNNITSYGFAHDYKLAVVHIVSTEYK